MSTGQRWVGSLPLPETTSLVTLRGSLGARPPSWEAWVGAGAGMGRLACLPWVSPEACLSERELPVGGHAGCPWAEALG